MMKGSSFSFFTKKSGVDTGMAFIFQKYKIPNVVRAISFDG